MGDAANTAPDAPNPLLNILRDIELPEPVSWWPPAPGWWIAALLALALLFWAVRALIMRYRAGAFRREAMTELELSHAVYKRDGDTNSYVQSVTSLLRRLAIHVSGRETVARLTGERWITHLNSLSQSPLPLDSASMLETGLYQKNSAIEVETIHSQVVDLVNGLITRDKSRDDGRDRSSERGQLNA